MTFRTEFSKSIFNHKYAHEGATTWEELSQTLIEDVCRDKISKNEKDELIQIHQKMQFIAGGRYLYYAGRPNKFFNNCFLIMPEEDSREDWANLSWKAESCLLTGGGIGIDYSIYRPKGVPIKKTGGFASGTLAKMRMINEIGREVMQGGSRRCLPENTMITMSDNTRKEIKNIKVGDMVQTRFGAKKVLATLNQGIQSTVTIKTKNGSVTSTENHRWLGADHTRKKRWIYANNFSLKNKLYYHPFAIEGNIKTDLNEAYVFGYFMGDGCAYHSNRTHEVTFQFAKSHYNINQILLFKNYMSQFSNPIERNGHGEVIELRCRNKQLVDEFQKLKTPHLKPNIPENILQWDVNSRCAFLAGWFDADGCFSDSWKIFNKHNETLKELQEIFLSVGIHTTIHGSEIRVCDYQRNQFISFIGKYCFKEIKNNSKLKITNEIPSDILSVSYSGFMQTYDIEVEEVNEFIADNFVSHNSAIYGSLNWQHGDIEEFLYSKDWDNIKIAGTDKSLADIKTFDFSFPAPLDMTNISLNYDNKFLELIHRENAESIYYNKEKNIDIKLENIPSTFIKNVAQALRTGEPNFSFNFYDKEKETARNAPVTKATRVLTIDGYKSVEEIIDKPTTLWTGVRWAENVVFKLTKQNTDLIKVNLTNGRSIICDPDHPFIVKVNYGKGKRKKESTMRVNAKLLNDSDIIYSNLPQNIYNKSNIFNEDYLYGFTFGDGSIKNNRGDLSYHTDTKFKPFAICCDILNQETKSNRIYFNSKVKDKHELMQQHILSPQFIAGYFDADGCYMRNLLRLSSSNIDNLYKIQESLDIYGIKSVVRKDGKSSYKPESIMYTLQVLSDSLLTFKSKIPTTRIKIDLDSFYKPYRASEIRVESVEELDYKEDVYCCDVGYEEHSFMAEGVLISNCTEVTSEDDSDVCNLGSINMANIDTIDEFKKIVELATKFLICGTLVAQLPYEKIYRVREKNRRLGLGLMGIHEWLLKRNYRYEVVPELHQWLQIYKDVSNKTAKEFSALLGISEPVAKRAIAPTGTIGILAGTTTGIEPLFAVAYKRRYLKGEKNWYYQYVVDGTAKILIEQYGLDPDKIESAIDLANDYERRIKFQADIQDYVDMSISSTLNIPAWDKNIDNTEKINNFAITLAKYAHRLRGFTCYPDGARGGQPLTPISYHEAKLHDGYEFAESFHDICDLKGGGTCGI